MKKIVCLICVLLMIASLCSISNAEGDYSRLEGAWLYSSDVVSLIVIQEQTVYRILYNENRSLIKNYNFLDRIFTDGTNDNYFYIIDEDGENMYRIIINDDNTEFKIGHIEYPEDKYYVFTKQ